MLCRGSLGHHFALWRRILWSVVSSLFFFYCYGDHRDLHSFPTRRSSDLASSAAHAGNSESSPSGPSAGPMLRDRKSTRLNSSHRCISYAVFCLKKKKKKTLNRTAPQKASLTQA